MQGNWRTRASEATTIRAVNTGGGATGGFIDPSSVTVKKRVPKGTPTPAQKRGKRRYYR